VFENSLQVQKAAPGRTAAEMAIRRAQKLLHALLKTPLHPCVAVEQLLEPPPTETLAQAENDGFERLLRGYGDVQDLDLREMMDLVQRNL
jgi:hypothetical protein